MRAMRAMCEDGRVGPKLMDLGVVEVLVRVAGKGKGDIWGEAVRALGGLAEYEGCRRIIAERGGLKCVLGRGFLEDGGRWTARFLGNMSRNGEWQVEIGHSGLNLLLMSVSGKNEHARREGARTLYNLSLGGVSRVMIGQGGALLPLVTLIGQTNGDTRRYAVGAVARISDGFEYATKLIEADVVALMLKAVKEDETLRKDTILCLSHLSQVIEVHGSLAASGAVKWLVDIVAMNGGRSEDAAEIMHYGIIAICNVAYSEGVTRNILRQSGAIPVLTAVANSGMCTQLVAYSAKQALLNLRAIEKPAMLPIEPTGTPTIPA